MKRDGKKRSDLTTGIALSNCYKRWPSEGGASPPDPSTRASAVDPMGALGIPQTPRRSSLIAHSLTSSYAPGTC